MVLGGARAACETDGSKSTSKHKNRSVQLLTLKIANGNIWWLILEMERRHQQNERRFLSATSKAKENRGPVRNTVKF